METSFEHQRTRAPRVRLSADPERIRGARPLWSSDDDADASGARAHLRDAVRKAVAEGLAAKQREVVEAYFFEGLSQGDIARRLGITQQVVHKRLYGAPRDGKLVGGAIHRLRGALAGLAPV